MLTHASMAAASDCQARVVVMLLKCSCGYRLSGRERQPSREAPLQSPAGCSGFLQPSCLRCSACGSSCRYDIAWQAVHGRTRLTMLQAELELQYLLLIRERAVL